MLEHEELTREVIGSAIEVHRCLGPGLLESVYHKCLYHELRARSVPFEHEVVVPIHDKGTLLESDFRLDIVVGGRINVELKAVDASHPVHEAQLLTYMKLTGLRVGLLINFNVVLLKEGIKRMVP